MIDVAAQQPKMLCRGIHRDFGLLFGILRDFKIGDRDRPMLQQVLGAVPLRFGQHLIGDRHLVVRIRA